MVGPANQCALWSARYGGFGPFANRIGTKTCVHKKRFGFCIKSVFLKVLKNMWSISGTGSGACQEFIKMASTNLPEGFEQHMWSNIASECVCGLSGQCAWNILVHRNQ